MMGFRMMGCIRFRVMRSIWFRMLGSIRSRGIRSWGIGSRSVGGWGIGGGCVRVSCPYCNNRDKKSNTGNQFRNHGVLVRVS